MTHTFATLGVSKAAFDEITQKLREAGYNHGFVDGFIDIWNVSPMKPVTPTELVNEHGQRFYKYPDHEPCGFARPVVSAPRQPVINGPSWQDAHASPAVEITTNITGLKGYTMDTGPVGGGGLIGYQGDLKP